MKYMISYSDQGKKVLNQEGVLPDYYSAFSYFLKGAQANEPESLFMLAECYFHGLGTDKNLKKADVFYHLAEEAGYEVSHKIYEKLESGGRDLTQDEIDRIVTEFMKTS